MPFINPRRIALTTLAALALTACGGGGSDAGSPVPPPANNAKVVNRVIVAGDSLADVGTFGLKFTVQKAGDSAGFPIFPELIQARYPSIAKQCNHFRAGVNSSFTNDAACNNFAIGGGRVVAGASRGGAASPINVGTQLSAAATARAPLTDTDLFIIDGGGNDAADLVGAYLGATNAAGIANLQTFLAQQLDAATLNNLLPQANGAALASAAYMTRLADTYFNAIKAQTLDKGAKKVVVLNMPDITLTPRFQAVLAGVAAQTGAANATALQGAIRQWIGAFNTQLRTRIGTTAEIGMVDFYAIFTAQVATPAQFGLTNATRAACPQTGTDSSGLPEYNFLTCTDNVLNAAPPSGLAGNWWQTWLFSDGFHPTPKGHQLMADEIVKVMTAKGWI
jgi:outer membrane lipase/esterase